jgi:hypothetical protein
MWTCMNRKCKVQKPLSEFGMAIARHGKTVSSNSRQCDECIQRKEAAEKEISKKSCEQVQKKPRADAEDMKQSSHSVEKTPKKNRGNKGGVEPAKKKSKQK